LSVKIPPLNSDPALPSDFCQIVSPESSHLTINKSLPPKLTLLSVTPLRYISSAKLTVIPVRRQLEKVLCQLVVPVAMSNLATKDIFSPATAVVEPQT
jgi:hypothetical protein